ncbi:MAG: GAF domain-containing protein [bacterium]|nr:GAF domain-containing protein [bacterium]
MAQKKTAKKTAKKAAAKTAAKAAKKKTAAKATVKTAAKATTKTASNSKATAKTVKKAAAKKSSARAASKSAPARSAAKGAAESNVGEQLRYCLENDRLSEQDLFATVARLLHDNLGYSALNVFYNPDANGKGGKFELLAATGEDPTLLYYADEPRAGEQQAGESQVDAAQAKSGGSAAGFSIKFPARPTDNALLDESSGLRPFTLPSSDDAADQDSAGAPDSDAPAGYPVAIHAQSTTKDAPLSILYIPFGNPDSEDAVAGFVAAVLVNPRPRYTKSDFEPAALIASVLRRNLLRFRLSKERAATAAKLAAARTQAALQAAGLEERIQVLEEQTGQQHQIRKELESNLAAESKKTDARVGEIESALAAERTKAAEREREFEAQLAAERGKISERESQFEAQLAETRRKANEREQELEAALSTAQSESESRQSALQARQSEFETLKKRAAELEESRAAQLAEQKQELDALLEMQERELREELSSQKTQIENLREELEAARKQNEAEASRLRSEQDSLNQKAQAAESKSRELAQQAEKSAAELQAARERLASAQREHEQKLERINNEHAEALAAANSGSASQINAIKSDYEKRLASETEGAEARLRERESELRQEIAKLTAARDDAGAEQELLGEELEKNVQNLKAAKSENDELRSRIAGLEEKISAAKKEQSALDERAGQLDGELAAARQATLDAERVNTSKSEENKRLQEQLAARISEVQELQRVGQAVAKELDGLKSNLGSRDQALQQEQSRSAERAGRIESLEAELSETRKDLAEQSASYDQLLKEEQDKQATASAELQKARTTIEQKETDYHNALYELKQKVNTLTETLERTRAETRESASIHSREIEELNAAARQNEAEHARKLTEQSNRAADLERQLGEARAQSERLSGELKSEQEALRQSNQSGEALRKEISALQSRIAGLEESHALEIKRLEEAAKSRESQTSQEIANRDDALRKARATIETHEQRLESLDRDVARLREEKSQLNQKLNEAGRLEKELRQDLATGAKTAAGLNADLSTARENIERLTGERDTAREEGARLRQDIGIRREREARLEQAIAGLKEEIHGLNNRLSEAGQKERELDQNIASLQTSLQSTRSELSEQYQKERKLGEELNAALAREKGSEEEGRLLASLTNAISNLPEFTDKIRYLRENVPGRADIERVVIYRLTDEDTLLFQDGYHGERRLEGLRGRRIRLQDTTFGQAMVSLRPTRLETADDLKNPDLPGELEELLDSESAEDELKSFLCLPLTESENGIGIMVLASSKADAFDDKHIRILGNIAPLFAVAVQFERNQAELQLHRTRIHNFKQVTHYQERRYLKTANQLHRLSNRILPVLKKGDGGDHADANPGQALSEDLMREINDYSQLALPASLQNAVDFLQWIETLGAKLSDGTNLQFEHNLSVDGLGRLADRIGSGFQNLYWLVGEALENVARHSQATRLEITLEESDGVFQFSVIDNGEGLVRTAGTDKPEHGTGLGAIANLAEAAGGHASFARDQNGHGLAVHVLWDPDENDLDATLRGAREMPVA